MTNKFYMGQKASAYIAELNSLHKAVKDFTEGQVILTCTATSSPGIVSGQNLKITLNGTSLLAGGVISSFNIESWAGTQTVPAVANSATVNLTATGAIGTVLTYTVKATDNYGNVSRAVTNTVNVVANSAPTGAIVVNSPTEVTSASVGNQISFSGLVDNDGTDFTYTVVQGSAPQYVFSKMSGIASGEVVTFTAPNLGANGVDTNVTFYVKGVDSLGAETAQKTVTIKTIMSHVVGVVLKTTGGGGGTWGQIDIDGNDIANQPTSYFDSNPPWQLTDVTVDGQAMIRCPKFYYKTGVISGGVNNGKTGWWISDLPRTGFSVHPAFMKAGVEVNQFYIGKYMASTDGTKMQSINGATLWNNMDLPTARTRASARNTGGVTGFDMISVWQAMAICWLYLIENRTMNSAKPYNYRGIIDVCGDVNGGTVSNCVIDGAYATGGNCQFFDYTGNGTYVGATGTFGNVLTPYPVTFKSGMPWQAGFFNATGTDVISSSTAPDSQYCTNGGALQWGSAGSGSAENGMFSFNDKFVAAAANIGTRLVKV